MANYWLHNGFLQVEGEKMSKSLGNFVTIRELLETEKFGGRKWPGSVLRLAMLSTHYRQPIDWKADALAETERTIREWTAVVGQAPPAESLPSDLIDALSDDLNTPLAISHMHALRKSGEAAGLRACMSALGIGRIVPVELNIELKTRVQALVGARAAARKAKNFAEADRIRGELDALGVALKDAKDPATGELVTTWEVKR
jgi:cysteinyl-tRNA synthetase